VSDFPHPANAGSRTGGLLDFCIYGIPYVIYIIIYVYICIILYIYVFIYACVTFMYVILMCHID